MTDDGWRRLAEYPAQYATGHWSTDPVLCPACAPLAPRHWNWLALPHPRSSGVRVVYAAPVPHDAGCSSCGVRRGSHGKTGRAARGG
jgi:hypothetical protein